MAVTLTLTGKTPNNTQFGLDTFAERYKCDATADVVLTDAGVPQMGDAHPDYPFMFVTGRPCYETGESASALDLIYTGCLTDDGDGNPILPPSQTTYGDSVMSASSIKAAGGLTAASPFTLQFYAPERNLSWITYGAKGDVSSVSDPIDNPTVITLTIGDASFSGTTFSVPALVAAFFTLQITPTIQSTELVAGSQFWLNNGKKIKHYVPFIFDLPPGFYPVPNNGGFNYQVGDSITVNSGGACVMTVVAIFNGYGSGTAGQIIGTTIDSNALSIASSSPINATGGSGSGASYTVIEIT